jgi:hypothetical protein
MDKEIFVKNCEDCIFRVYDEEYGNYCQFGIDMKDEQSIPEECPLREFDKIIVTNK